MNLRRDPAKWHLASLVAGFAVIMALQRDQWFFLDEWAFLKLGGPGFLEPHVGHWSTSPMALTHVLRNVFGLDSYVPFAIAVTLAHLATAHVVWRITVRAGANPWLATAGTAVLVFLGSGAENILWAFQVGFLTALALSLLAFSLANAADLSRRRLIGVISLSIFALTWSGTAIPLVAATAALIYHRHGIRRALVYAGACGVVYLGWYVTCAVGNPNNPDTGGLGVSKIFVKIPRFLGVMVLYGWQSIFPVVGIGAIVLIALLAWLIRLWRTRARVPGLSPALFLTGAAAMFAFMAAYSRAEWSVGSGRSSRYLYVLFVLLLPLCLVALTRLTRDRTSWIVGAAALLVALGGFQVAGLAREARDQAETEQGVHRLFSAALSLHVDGPDAIDINAQPDSRWAPDATMFDLIALYELGALPIGPYGPYDLETVRTVVVLPE